MPSIFIDDGFTLDGLVPALKGVYPELRFTYRPALPERVYAWQRERRDTGKQVLEAGVKLLCEQLVSWDAQDRSGNVVPINELTLRRVFQGVLERLLDAVTGYAEARADDEKN